MLRVVIFDEISKRVPPLGIEPKTYSLYVLITKLVLYH